MRKFILFITFCCIIASCQESRFTTNCQDPIVEQVRTDTLNVLATKYNPVVEQCWGDPLITADNSRIDIGKLRNYEVKWIAISRELREDIPYGTEVEIISDNPNLCGVYEVHDTMNKRFTKRIDFLVPENDTLQFHAPDSVKLVIRYED